MSDAVSVPRLRGSTPASPCPHVADSPTRRFAYSPFRPSTASPRVLITGASSGIGRALALELGRRGARLSLTGRDHTRLEEVAAQVTPLSPRKTPPLVVPGDVTYGQDVRRIVTSSITALGGLDVLVNNAGIGVYGETERTSMADARAVFEVNLFAPLALSLEALPTMKAQRQGLLVNIASLAALRGVPYLSAYSASKAALAAWGQALGAELAGSGVSVLTVYPGYTETPFFAHEKQVGGARRPRGPYASAERVAQAVVRAIETGRQELVLSCQGRVLAALEALCPQLVGWMMAALARRLRTSTDPVADSQSLITES